jgi:class II lanthipeptide synthase
MDFRYDHWIDRAATIDERLSHQFEPLPGQKADADLAALRLAAWCRSAASGDWSLFRSRLDRDRVQIGDALARFATVRRNSSAQPSAWMEDGRWILSALEQDSSAQFQQDGEDYPFRHFFAGVIERAEASVRARHQGDTPTLFDEAAWGCLRRSLLAELSGLCAPALYEAFDKGRKAAAQAAAPEPQARSGYQRFVEQMRSGGFRRLFEDKPVLLRLIATAARQWIDSSAEFMGRLEDDAAVIRRDLLSGSDVSPVAGIESGVSDPHNDGRSVKIVTFEDGRRVVYKPKDLRLDATWHQLIERLNRADAPIELRAARAVALPGYGWAEYIDHRECADSAAFARFFRRCGAWLALLHCFAATDMHQENIIADGEHPVPIDLEMLLQSASKEQKSHDSAGEALEAASELLSNSVMTVGLLPSHGRSPDTNIFSMGGLAPDWSTGTTINWENVNSDKMRPVRAAAPSGANTNLPYCNGRCAKLQDHIDQLIGGFKDYATFLLDRRDSGSGDLFDGFSGLPVRKVLRPTRFYHMLLQRLKNHRAMNDGAIWSAQADFTARLSDWERGVDAHWALQHSERSALLALNVPHFVSPSDRHEVRDANGVLLRLDSSSGLDRARSRLDALDAQEIAWQLDVIRENTRPLAKANMASETLVPAGDASRTALSNSTAAFITEADKVALQLSRHAIRRGRSAAWIGLDWLGDSDLFQLVCLGPDLYNGVSGIAVFLAAHGAATGSRHSLDLALAAMAQLRGRLRSRNGARTARLLGIGGATGLGSIVYALTVISRLLRDDDVLDDACAAAALFTTDLIAADKRLDAIGGSAGAILGLLKLHRETRAAEILARAVACGEHLLAQPRIGPIGRRSWIGQGMGPRPLNGMSHGASGFAYALAALAVAADRQDFADAAAECIAFEDAAYDSRRHNWPDLRGAEASWPCQWCHGAIGIGMARLAIGKRGRANAAIIASDIRNAVEAAVQSWPGRLDTLCCGTLGNLEFICEAGSALGREDLQALGSRRLLAIVAAAEAAGDYRWNSGSQRFNLGLFRGLAGVGYTLLRRADPSLPNVLAWD